MGNFCSQKEIDEQCIIQQRKSSSESFHYSQKPLKRLEKSESVYSDLQVSMSPYSQLVTQLIELKEASEMISKSQLRKSTRASSSLKRCWKCRNKFYLMFAFLLFNTPQTCTFELESCLYDLEQLAYKKQLSDIQIQFITAQIALAIHEIHKSGYIYRALNPSHILIAEDGYIRLIGFGFSSNKTVFFKINTYEEIRIFPPEAMEMLFDQSGDWWLLGALLYKLLFDCYPFENDDRDVETLKQKKKQNVKEFPREIDPNLQDLIENLLKWDPLERLTKIELIMQHKYFCQIDWKLLKEKLIESPLKE
ncbi:unnamed protein product (macronuclear) [Paramecium tetraurelia]|uniref:Protein kinase domain-containing protein n=1 Tax=Paramecium tetraurelia TaxID=5888 RepID=A0DMJ1_PARTE|nr:uncharacterized protein GSPATT00018476001 [Paramecium tetraurelia]CAK84258.1 unnamed protein product [Paramecium tetraurelia]|eukprot:XP_001451655.1 hypothetical protein (macronuclear) [Paramecium tetraurelia strain d4-2]